MITKQYNVVNNIGGWVVFLIALATYWLTLEPTASYWDCGEFIVQGQKLEVGHPPGNPIFMLTANLFANFAPTPEKVGVMINAMSGLLSALTILILFWTITHLVRRLVVKDGRREELTLQQYLIVMGSGLVGSLAYCWSDTFWFSAVESEVYAFSSFCTALVFWLILKWENRADQPHSDRWLILVAYVIGVSLAVHLLNLLCIPAIVLVFVYKKYPGTRVAGSIVGIIISFFILYFVLYGLMPGFLKSAQVTELLFVNGFHLGFNSGAIAYAIIMVASLLWALFSLYKQKSEWQIKVSFILAVTLSGMLFVGSGITIGIVLTVGLIALLFFGFKNTGLPVRVMNVIMWSIAAIFIGFSSYAVILIRSSANTPMNENSPDNVFALASYLNREQYGETPLVYGPTLFSSPQTIMIEKEAIPYEYQGQLYYIPDYDIQQRVEPGAPIYAKGVPGAVPLNPNEFLSGAEVNNNERLAEREGDHYVLQDYRENYVMNPELNMVFPRIYSKQHAKLYQEWVDGMNYDKGSQMERLSIYDPATEESVKPDADQLAWLEDRGMAKAFKPTFKQNLEYFFNYQLNHMYLRYFLWNFVGRQNDIMNQHGELDAGNWISGFTALDDSRLGDQSLLPDHLGKGNRGHNVYYFLPLILGLIGLIWQVFAGRRGIEQFWVVFFLFFMTGIAIVLYLNQYPGQPRERDYAFAGSFYAFTIWIGMGVAGLWRFFMLFVKERPESAGPKAEKPLAQAPKPGDAASKPRKPYIKPVKPSLKERLRKGLFGREEEGAEPAQSVRMTEEPEIFRRPSLVASIIAVAIGICIPIQMVSQTWDDHDRSGRYAARDFAINYLESLEPNAIVFCNGDNDTFPLWYAQEVEGVRPDVRIINLSYLNSDWYANQHRIPAYDAAPAPFTATPQDIAYGKHAVALVPYRNSDEIQADLLQTLKRLYQCNDIDFDPRYNYYSLAGNVLTIPVDKKLMVERGLVAPKDTAYMADDIRIDLRGRSYLTLGDILMLDIIATNAAEGWPRPIYWASTVGEENHAGLTPYLQNTGMAYQLTPVIANRAPRTDVAYKNITEKFQWGTRDDGIESPYYDETARRMLYGMRNTMLNLADMLVTEGEQLEIEGEPAKAKGSYEKALVILKLMQEKLPEKLSFYEIGQAQQLAELYCSLSARLGQPSLKETGLKMLEEQLTKYAPALRYYSEINRTFKKKASLTLEMTYMPYYYNLLVETYLDYGGSQEYVEKLLKKQGWSLQALYQTVDAMLGNGMEDGNMENYDYEEDAGGDGEVYTLQDLALEIIEMCEQLDFMKQHSPEEYRQVVGDLDIDDLEASIEYGILYYIDNGGDEEVLKQSEAYNKLDRAETARKLDEFLSKYPY